MLLEEYLGMAVQHTIKATTISSFSSFKSTYLFIDVPYRISATDGVTPSPGALHEFPPPVRERTV